MADPSHPRRSDAQRSPQHDDPAAADGVRIANLDFDSLVSRYYQPLYRFAMSLARSEADASDLVQETFYLWAAKGHQLRDPSKVKTWLFTTLHREFLEKGRRQTRFPHQELESAEFELPNLAPDMVSHLDSLTVVHKLGLVDAAFQAPVALFYLEDYSYQEIADILGVPIGTIKSRIHRGLTQLERILAGKTPHPARHG